MRTSAMAERAVFADVARRMADPLLGGKVIAQPASRNVDPRILMNVAELPVVLDEEVARINVPVVLDHRVAVAGFVHGAGSRHLPGKRFGEVVEEANGHAPHVRPPQVEQLAEKTPVLL